MSGVRSAELQAFYIKHAVKKIPLPEEHDWLRSMLPPSEGNMFTSWDVVWQFINPQASQHFVTKRGSEFKKSNLIWPQAGHWVYDSIESQVQRLRVSLTKESEAHMKLVEQLEQTISNREEVIKSLQSKQKQKQESSSTTNLLVKTKNRCQRYTIENPPPYWKPREEVSGVLIEDDN
jgi:hypothetical protein